MAERGKSISLQVKGLDTVGSIKVKIWGVECIPFDEQELIYRGKALENMDSLVHLGIKKDSILKLMTKSSRLIKIFIKKHEKWIVSSLEVKPNDTIIEIKHKISCSSGDLLIFNETVLEDSGTIADYNIVNGSTLTHIVKSMGRMEIFVNTYTGKTISLLVDPAQTIADVKLLIELKEGIPSEEQVLIFSRMVLGDTATLYDFNIRRKYNLKLMHKPTEFSKLMKIFIKTPSGNTFTEKVKPSDTIGNLKARIQDKVDVPSDEQELIFNEIVLSDIGTVADYHINNESTLTIMRISSGMFMRILIKTLSQKTIALDVKPSDTIHDVKTKIYEKEDYPPSKQTLIFRENQLQDSATIVDYHIEKGSTIHLVLRLS